MSTCARLDRAAEQQVFHVDGFWSALWFSVILWLARSFLLKVDGGEKQEE